MHYKTPKGSRKYVDDSPYRIEPEGCKGRWSELFNNSNPVFVEVGCGRGSFITEMCKRHPDLNFIGVELYSAPIYSALKKAESQNPNNLLFLRMSAEFLRDVFDKGEVAGIYINFADPWPKDARGNKRLTSSHFLEIYRDVLPDDGKIMLKTDSDFLFEFSLSEADASGWDVSETVRDLHANGNPEWNVMTDYEMSFVSKGIAIKRAVFSPKPGRS